MNARAIFILIAALVVAAIAVGCGGDDEESEGASSAETAAATADSGSEGDESQGGDSSGSTEPPIATSSRPKPIFVRKAEEICSRAEARIFNPQDETLSQQEIEEATIVEGLIPALEGVADGIRRLGAPVGDEAEVEGIVVAFQEAADGIKERGASSFPQAEKFLPPTAKLAKEYGLKRCVFK